MQEEDVRRVIGEGHDMREGVSDEVRRCILDIEYCGEQTRKKSDPILVEQGEKVEQERFYSMGASGYDSRDEARRNLSGKTVKVRRVRINKGSEPCSFFVSDWCLLEIHGQATLVGSG